MGRDFRHVRHFPGHPTPLGERAKRVFALLEALPGPVFALVPAALAFAGARGEPLGAAALFAFVLGDWLLVALLPRFGRSYGPVHPQVLALAILRAPFGLLPPPFALLAQAAGTALAVDGFWFEPHRLTLTRERLRSARVPAGPPLRLLHLGDLHVERITGREREVIGRARALAPDAIVFSGDFLSTSYLHDPEAHEACRWFFRRLAAPLGVFVVSGSPAIDRDDVLPGLLADLPVRWLRDERVTLAHGTGAVELVGLSCTHRPFVDAPRLAALLAGPADDPARPFTILLHHSPDLAPDAAALGVDLHLAGHTHGGQVRVPGFGALVTASLHGKRFEMGRRQVDGLTLYVTRGLGLEGTGAPRVRFLCPPELTLWEIEGDDSCDSRRTRAFPMGYSPDSMPRIGPPTGRNP